MSCDYCEESGIPTTIREEYIGSFLDDTFYINMNMMVDETGDARLSSYVYSENGGGSDMISEKINYCPFCGRKLIKREK